MTSSATTRTFFNEKPSRISKSSFKRERLVREDVYTTGLRTFESHRGLVLLLFSPGTRPFAAKFRGRMSNDFHPFSFRNRGERERQEKGAKAWKRQRNSGERNVKGTDRFGMKLTHSIARLFPLSILPSSLWVRRKLALSPGYHKRVCLYNVIEQLLQNRYFFVMLFDPLFCLFLFLCPSEWILLLLFPLLLAVLKWSRIKSSGNDVSISILSLFDQLVTFTQGAIKD